MNPGNACGEVCCGVEKREPGCWPAAPGVPNVDADGPGDAWVCIQDPAPPDALRLGAFGFGVDGTAPTVCRDVPGAAHVENMMRRRKTSRRPHAWIHMPAEAQHTSSSGKYVFTCRAQAFANQHMSHARVPRPLVFVARRRSIRVAGTSGHDGKLPKNREGWRGYVILLTLTVQAPMV